MPESNPDLSHIEPVDLKPVEITAVQSPVEFYSDTIDDYVCLGHISMFDMEQTSLESVKNAVKDKIGFGIILNSHGNNYHVWDTRIKSLQAVREVKDSVELDDNDHNIVGVEKNCHALRISNKGDKSRPEFMGFAKSPDVNLKEFTHSTPHLIILSEVFNVDIADTILNECKTVGKETKIVEYITYQNNHDVEDLPNAEDVLKNREGVYNG